jgi:hypothetical protein
MTKIKGVADVVRKNPHIGSSFESWLDETVFMRKLPQRLSRP